jgi:flagellar basal body-associated protein FliL
MRRLVLLSILLAAALAVPAPAVAAEGAAAEKADKPGDKDKKDKKAAVHKVTQSESYLMVDPLYTSILDGNRPLGLLMVGIGIDVPDKDLRERVERDMPRLRDGYVRALMAFTAVNVRSWRQPDVAALADRLQVVTDRLLGKKGARVLLAQVAIRLNN